MFDCVKFTRLTLINFVYCLINVQIVYCLINVQIHFVELMKIKQVCIFILIEFN